MASWTAASRTDDSGWCAVLPPNQDALVGQEEPPMTIRWRWAAVLLLGVYVLAYPQPTASQQPEAGDTIFRSLLAARSLKCSFAANAFADWKSGTPKLTLAREDLGLHFDSIDSKAQKARLIANQGAGDVTVFTTPEGLHFIEQTASGNMVFTTVFASRASDGFIAVTSRHMNLLGGPLPSQYHGVCKRWQ